MDKTSFFAIDFNLGRWTIFPWLTTYDDGWTFSWVFLRFGRIADDSID